MRFFWQEKAPKWTEEELRRVSDRWEELCRNFRKQVPYLTMEEIEAYIDKREAEREARPVITFLSDHKRSIIWSGVGVCALLLSLAVYIPSHNAAREPVAQVKQPSPLLPQDTVRVSQISEVPVSAAVTDRKRMRSVAASGDMKQSGTDPAVIPGKLVNWVPKQITPPKIYELDSTELARLGAVVLPNGEFQFPSEGKVTVTLEKSDERGNTYLIGRPKRKTLAPAVVPYLSTNEKGYTLSAIKIDSTFSLSSQRVIPLKVILTKDSAFKPGDAQKYIILWYEYTDVLLTLLPERVKKEIELNEDMRLDARFEKRGIFVDIVLPKDSKSAVVEYQNIMNEKVALALYDVQGGMLELISEDALCSQPVCSITLPTGNYKPGVYLLTISTAQGTSEMREVYIR